MSVSGSRTSVPVRAAAVLAWGAAMIHLVLHPGALRRAGGLRGVLPIGSGFQVALGWLLLRRPTPRVLRAGALGSLVLLSTWVITRAVAPPLSSEGRPESVTLLGVLATGAELATLLILSSYLPIPSQGARWKRRTWSTIAGAGFAALVLLASGALSYVSLTGGAPSLQVAADGFSMNSPLVFGLVVPHLWLVGPWSTLLLTAVASLLVSANVSTLILRAPEEECRLRPQTAGALATPLFAVSSCCGTPAALFLGAGSVSFLFRLTPWLLLATTAMLAVNLIRIRIPIAEGSRPGHRKGRLKVT